MRYIDSGDRDGRQTLATWFASITPNTVSAIRVQAGFFASTSLPFVRPLLDELTTRAAHISILIGSNDGQTSRASVASLLQLVGPARPDLRVGIVRFAGSFFHAKTYHVTRHDGTMTAYVGSANLTDPGMRTHVEAGLIVDQAEGDDPAVLTAIATATDAWFAAGRAGLTVIDTRTDLDALVSAGIIGVPRPTAPSGARTPIAPRLAPLVSTPTMPTTIAISWSKGLDKSNAQRKPGGNNRGAITLTRGRVGDTQTYFRNVLFGTAAWVAGFTRTGQPVDTAIIPMNVTVDGVSLGVVQMEVTNSPYRRQGPRNNATSHLHVGDLAPQFAATNMTGKTLTISLRTDGSYDLNIA